MNEVKQLATEIIVNLSNLDLKPTTNNLNNLLAIHDKVARIITMQGMPEVKATEIHTEEKKVDNK